MSVCSAHWAQICDPANAAGPCPICQALVALEDIAAWPSTVGDPRDRLGFCVALAQVALVQLTAETLQGGNTYGKGEHRPPEDNSG